MLPLFSIKFYVQRIQSLIIKRQYLKLPSSFDNSTTEQNYKIANTSIYTFFRVSFLSTHKDQRFHTPASPRKGIYFLFTSSVGCGRINYSTIFCELRVNSFFVAYLPICHFSVQKLVFHWEFMWWIKTSKFEWCVYGNNLIL